MRWWRDLLALEEDLLPALRREEELAALDAALAASARAQWHEAIIGRPRRRLYGLIWHPERERWAVEYRP